jgi:hypothetical protein
MRLIVKKAGEHVMIRENDVVTKIAKMMDG